MPKRWTIYRDRELPSGKIDTCVLLDDGCWGNQDMCNQYSRYAEGAAPIVMHRPRLFATKGGASNYLKTRLGLYRCYRVARYDGPTDPDARPVREVWQLVPDDFEPIRIFES